MNKVLELIALVLAFILGYKVVTAINEHSFEEWLFDLIDDEAWPEPEIECE